MWILWRFWEHLFYRTPLVAASWYYSKISLEYLEKLQIWLEKNIPKKLSEKLPEHIQT